MVWGDSGRYGKRDRSILAGPTALAVEYRRVVLTKRRKYQWRRGEISPVDA